MSQISSRPPCYEPPCYEFNNQSNRSSITNAIDFEQPLFRERVPASPLPRLNSASQNALPYIHTDMRTAYPPAQTMNATGQDAPQRLSTLNVVKSHFPSKVECKDVACLATAMLAYGGFSAGLGLAFAMPMTGGVVTKAALIGGMVGGPVVIGSGTALAALAKRNRRSHY